MVLRNFILKSAATKDLAAVSRLSSRAAGAARREAQAAKDGEGTQDARIRLKPSVSAQVAHLEFLRRPLASPPLRGFVPPAALDDTVRFGDYLTASQEELWANPSRNPRR